MARLDEALELFGQGYSCSQAVMGAYGQDHGLDRETLLALGRGLGGGMGRLGLTCGAVSGAMVVLGLACPEGDDEARRKERVYGAVGEFTARFKASHGSIICRDLLELDISDPADYELIKQRGLFKSLCPRLVADAGRILEEIIAAGI